MVDFYLIFQSFLPADASIQAWITVQLEIRKRFAGFAEKAGTMIV